jgi:hypothetical protein
MKAPRKYMTDFEIRYMENELYTFLTEYFSDDDSDELAEVLVDFMRKKHYVHMFGDSLDDWGFMLKFGSTGN